jgi:NhaP-type Na+/H+ or K+/H+ antiporter
MTFSLLVLGSGVPGAERIFDIAALVVLCSIVAHGLSDTPGSEWMARKAEAETAAAAQDEPASRYSSGSAKGAISRPSTSTKP